MAAPTLVSLSETENESTTTMETQTELIDTPSWSSSAHAASLSNALNALTLAGVLVTNTDLDSVLLNSFLLEPRKQQGLTEMLAPPGSLSPALAGV